MPDDIDNEDEVVSTPESRGDILPEDKTEAKTEDKTEDKTEAKTEDKAEDKTETPSGQSVPLTRFKAQNLALKEAREELEQLRQQMAERAATPPPTPVDTAPKRDIDAELTAAEEKLAAAYKDNDVDAIMEQNRAIRALERAQYNQGLEELRQTQTQTQQSFAATAFDDTLNQVETDFPELDPTSDRVDPAKIQLVQELVDGYEARGVASHKALLQAVSLVFPEAPAPAPAPAAVNAPPTVDSKLRAIKQTPPDLASAGGVASDEAGMNSTIDVSKLSDEEFDALPKDVVRRLRGDIAAA